MSVTPSKILVGTFIMVIAILIGGAFLLALAIGIWLPDVFVANQHTLATGTSTNGYSFRVVQYWNRVDFYSTELHVTAPNGRTEVRTLDGDDSKTWSVPLLVDEERHVVSVTLRGGRVKKESW